MTRVERFNPHRWVVILHVAFILKSKVNAQSLTPTPNEFQAGENPSKTTVFAVLVTIFFVVGLLSVYIRHCIRSNPGSSNSYFHGRANDGCSRRGGLDDAFVESFPVFAYSSVKESKIGSGDLECAVCLNELKDRETVRLLPICNHLFHIDCIGTWLHSHATCPVCRSNLKAKSVKTAVEDDGLQLAENAAMRDHVTIDIETVEAAKSHHLRPSSEIAGKFPRSNSTGHSIGRFSDDTERYTLRLPDDVKRRIMAAKGRRFKRTRSFDADLTAECRGKFSRSGEESSNHDVIGSDVKLDWAYWVDRWGLYVSKSNSDSVKSQTSNGEPLK